MDEEVFFTGNSELDHQEDAQLVPAGRQWESRDGARYPLAGPVQLEVPVADYFDHAVGLQVDDLHFFPTGKTPKEKVGVLVDQSWQ